MVHTVSLAVRRLSGIRVLLRGGRALGGFTQDFLGDSDVGLSEWWKS